MNPIQNRYPGGPCHIFYFGGNSHVDIHNYFGSGSLWYTPNNNNGCRGGQQQGQAQQQLFVVPSPTTSNNLNRQNSPTLMGAAYNSHSPAAVAGRNQNNRTESKNDYSGMPRLSPNPPLSSTTFVLEAPSTSNGQTSSLRQPGFASGKGNATRGTTQQQGVTRVTRRGRPAKSK